MFYLFKHKEYRWIDSFSENPVKEFKTALESIIDLSTLKDFQLVFLCIGTPNILGDSLGPAIGTVLQRYGVTDVYGSLDEPVHALNIDDYRDLIKNKYTNPFVIAIDAALGQKSQTGLITLKKGPLYPGKGVGKKIQPIGNLQITGVFDTLHNTAAYQNVVRFTTCICNSIFTVMK